MSPETRERSFDELAIRLASGSVSRRKALRMMGAALVGGAMASIPGMAWAAKGGGGGKSSCAKYCTSLFGGDTAAQAECTSQGTKGTGPCYSCTPGVGPGPNFTPNCIAPHTKFNDDTCQCECPTECPPGELPECSSCECISSTTCPPNIASICLFFGGQGCCPIFKSQFGGCLDNDVCVPQGTTCPVCLTQLPGGGQDYVSCTST
jgi:hypothetical protein